MAFLTPIRTSLSDIAQTAEGIVSQSMSREVAASTATLSTQVIYAMRIPVRAGVALNNFVVCVAVAASGTAPTLIKLALLTSAGVVIDQTANLASDGAWTSKGIKTFAFPGGTYRPTADGALYGAVLKNGVFSVTEPQLTRAALPDVVVAKSVGSGVRTLANQTGQTDFAANTGSQTLVDPTSASAFWIAVS